METPQRIQVDFAILKNDLQSTSLREQNIDSVRFQPRATLCQQKDPLLQTLKLDQIKMAESFGGLIKNGG